MNCYDFEAKISAYIDGELKQSEWKSFSEHKKVCEDCNNKLEDIKGLISSMSNAPRVRTSADFMTNLQNKIEDHQSRKSLSGWLKNFTLFGMEPLPAVGFSAAIAVLLVSSFILFNDDAVPTVDFDELSRNSSSSPATGNYDNSSFPLHDPGLLAEDSESDTYNY